MLLAIKWLGIPAGLALGAISYVQFKRFDTDPEGFDRTARSLDIQSEQLRWACLAGMILGAILVILSPVLLLLESQGAGPRDSSSGHGIIPVEYRGTWAFSNDCENPYSRVIIDEDDVDMPGSVSFVARGVVSHTSNSVELRGATLAGNAEQNETVRLVLSGDRRSLTLNGDGVVRCGE